MGRIPQGEGPLAKAPHLNILYRGPEFLVTPLAGSALYLSQGHVTTQNIVNQIK